jgi:hypothetical protein
MTAPPEAAGLSPVVGTYHIIWRIDLDDSGPIEAAERALRIHRRPSSTATVFEVTAPDGTEWEIDLTEGTCIPASPTSQGENTDVVL